MSETHDPELARFATEFLSAQLKPSRDTTTTNELKSTASMSCAHRSAVIAWGLVCLAAGAFRAAALVEDPVLEYYLLVACSLAGFSALENLVGFFSQRPSKRATAARNPAPAPPPIEKTSSPNPPRYRGRDFTMVK